MGPKWSLLLGFRPEFLNQVELVSTTYSLSLYVNVFNVLSLLFEEQR